MHVPTLTLCSRVVGLLMPFLMVGCSGYQYVASPRYVPMNEKKGDININISPASVQLGYAFSNRFSGFATGFRRIPTRFFSEQYDAAVRTCKSGEINLGLSYFSGKKKLRHEIVVGGGMGEMAFFSSKEITGPRTGPRTLNMQADKWNVFIQPNLTYKIGNPIDKFLAFAVFTKFNSVNYYNTTLTRMDTDSGTKHVEQVVDLVPEPGYDYGLVYFSSHEKSNLFFIEPGIFIKAGTKNFKGITQFCYVINTGGPLLHYQPLSITLGVAINLNVFDLKAAKKERKK